MLARRCARALVAALLGAVAVLASAGAATASAHDDASCATRPASVPLTYSCRTLHELPPSNNAGTSYGEVWYLRSGDILSVRIFPTLGLTGSDPIQVCVSGAAFEPRKNGNAFRCVGGESSRVYVGSSLSLDLDVSGIGTDLAYYFQVHVNQGGRSTFTGDTDEGGPYTSPPSGSSAAVSSSGVCMGEAITFVAGGFKPKSAVRFDRTVFGETTESLGSATADSAGRVSRTVQIPAAKTYNVAARGIGTANGSQRLVDTDVTGKDCSINAAGVASEGSVITSVKQTTTSPGTWLIGLALLMMLVPPLRRRRRNNA